MGLRFRKRLRLLPGLYVNLSKSGASVSVGGHGFTENISRRGVRTTLSIPGTGLSYTTRTAKWRWPQPMTEEEGRENSAAFAAIGKTIAVLIFLLALFAVIMAAANSQTQAAEPATPGKVAPGAKFRPCDINVLLPDNQLIEFPANTPRAVAVQAMMGPPVNADMATAGKAFDRAAIDQRRSCTWRAWLESW
jgi:Protein of unknown function (DUF4236)